MGDAAEEFLDSADFDLDYEFDAPRFFDFTTPESPSQAAHADRWFLFADSHSPSPLIIKLKWTTNELFYGESLACESADRQEECSTNHDTDVNMDAEDTPKGSCSQKSTPKSQLRPYFPKSSTLLKPTASHLAKLNQLGSSSPKSNGRFQNPASPLNNSADAIPTKRQKLDNGYLRKASQLSHQSSFAHKSSGKVVPSNSGSAPLKSKVTVPKGPILKTNCRARRFRSAKAVCQDDPKISNQYTFKALPLNKKIFEGPLLAQPKKSTPCLPEFQEFHLKTAERAFYNSSDNNDLSIKRSPLSPRLSKLDNSSMDVFYRFKSQPANRKESKLSGDKKCSHNLPTELFSKLSLKSDNHPISQEELKENLPPTLPPNGNMSPSRSPRRNVKHSQCGGVKTITSNHAPLLPGI